ncbi:allantoicase [Paroceanicella profunda]|uniref:Probable allantoicase n=1 Tax=Paroceanicella profunda TaxID=2579971 RepID=A0A5B8FTS3_9RHOB|nr:allantoicase [Paroceanicella profunda]QDL90704.1 allantoicase [Paroceanicella profunda]
MTDIVAAPAPLPDWALGKINLASPRLGATTLRCTDDFFAPMARMLQDAPAVFKPDVYDENGKWMDGWESIRRRNAGHDWCIIRLGGPGRIAGVDFDTSHFTGNYPRAASLWAAEGPTPPEDDAGWTEIVPATTLSGNAHTFAEAVTDGAWTHLRLNIFPDGGMARLRVYGDPLPDWEAAGSGVVELSALRNGGRVLGYNDAHYGDVWALLSEGRPVNMGDGWETRRRREPGNDWLILALGAPGIIEKVEIDTGHYRGNYPDRAGLQAAEVRFGTDDSIITQSMFWPTLLEPQKMHPAEIHTFGAEALNAIGTVTHLKLNIFPDGGIGRLRIWGRRA